MTKDRDHWAECIFAKAISIGDPLRRADYLQRTCARRPALRREVDSLLQAHEGAGDFLETLSASVLETVQEGRGEWRRIGDFELLGEIARGGMGIVYKARQVSLGRMVALKMILGGQFATQAEVRRFHAEAAAAGRLHHPHILSIYEMGEWEGRPYYTMPLVEGRSLAQLVEEDRWQAGDGIQAAQIIARVARAVQHAHEQGILHRDLKPHNILIDAAGEPHVADFGLAKHLLHKSSLTQEGDLLGTPGFMAPEQAQGKGRKVTAAADIYSLGALLYFLLTGRPPFVADSALDIVLLMLEGEAVMPRSLNRLVPSDLERICMRSLAKAPENRYPSAGALAEDLERFLRGEPMDFPTMGVSQRLRAWFKRKPALASRLGGLLVCGVISEVAFRIYAAQGLNWPGSPAQHYRIMLVLGVWAVISGLCQWGLKNERWANTIRLVWAGADTACLTAVLLIDQALESPLMALYPAWVAGSGLWLRVPLVVLSAGMAMLGYGVLLVVAYFHDWPAPQWAPHWHLVGLFMLALTGFVVAYLVHRVRVLSRY